MVTTAAEGGVVSNSSIGGTCKGHLGNVSLGMLRGAGSGRLLLLGRLAYSAGHGRLPAAYPRHVSFNSPLLLNLHATHKTLICDY